LSGGGIKAGSFAYYPTPMIQQNESSEQTFFPFAGGVFVPLYGLWNP
jgi:hypothetical protein